MKGTVKKAESLMVQTLKDSELRYRRLFEATQDGILILDARTGMIEDVNPYLIKMLGYSREEFVEKKLWEVDAFKDIKASQDAFEALQKNETIRYDDLPLKTKEGRLIQVEFVSNVYLVGSAKVIQCNIRDNTEHKRIIVALQKNEKKYYDLVNQSPEGVFIIELSGHILTVNKAMCRELAFSEEELLSMNIWELIPEQYLDQYRKSLTKILKGESLKEAAEYVVRGKDGKNHYVEVLSAPHYSGKDVIDFQGIARDITARKQSEQSLRESEERYRSTLESMLEGCQIIGYDWRYLFINDSAVVQSKLKKEELLGHTMMECYPGIEKTDMFAVLRRCMDERTSHLKVNEFIYPDGSKGWFELSIQPVPNGIFILSNNITERKQAEREIVSLAKFPSENPAPVLRLSRDGIVMYANKASGAFLDMWGCAVGGSAPQLWCDLVAQAFVERENKTIELEWNGKIYSIIIAPVAEMGYVNLYGSDITERKQAQERIQRQLEHLTAMSGIDRVISANFDLKLSLSEILTHVTIELGIDAADILILNSDLQMLEFGAERGFRNKAVLKTPLRLRESYAGRAVLEHQLIQIPNLREEPDILSLTTRLKGEDFVCYYGEPLIVKGQVKGVLEVFHRSALEPDTEWFDFLNTLAGQAAIAVEITTLFESLQLSNSELFLAYDATIEGWSQAMDLRDKETEGHTHRVTEMTLELGRLFGLSEADLVQARWGALLHDIGKMGVPDRILLKPESLTDEEWVAMKKHPTFAYEMLAPIRYLRQALDIPYCHHEKWDGSGYPRGLKGTQIPLVARIFAVVDVWDALNSDRPYRAAWPAEKVLDHIRSQAGTHFDPQVVKICLESGLFKGQKRP
jgi:PAS domain S-box-containing protein/putative nucleotidyltransferase with HDIG domain